MQPEQKINIPLSQVAADAIETADETVLVESRCPNGHHVPSGTTLCPTCNTFVAGSVPAPPTGSVLPQVPGYELLQELGRGGMGVVYKARHLRLNRIVALKMILAGDFAGADARQRFQREAEAVARLQHPNVVQVHEFGEAGGKAFFSLEFVDGESLADRLRGKPLTPNQAAHVLLILAKAVHCAHEQGIVHRDLKPANILIAGISALPAEQWVPKIADFGLAKRLDEVTQHTQSGAILGTPSYMSPEQAAGHRELGPAADVYALGVILYEMLTGKLPFADSANPIELLERIRREEPLSPRAHRPEVSRDLEAVCLKCLEKTPADRYISAKAFAEDLERFLEDCPVIARPNSWTNRLSKWFRSRRRLVAAMTFLAFAAAVGYLTLADQGLGVPAGDSVRDTLDRNAWSILRPIAARQTIRTEAKELRKHLAKTMIGSRVYGPFVGFRLATGRTESPNHWTQGQVLLALAACPEVDDQQLKEFAPAFPLLMTPDSKLAENFDPFLPGYGWPGDEKVHYHAAPPGLWILASLSRFLARKPGLTEEDNKALHDYLRQITSTYNSYQSLDEKNEFVGAWNFYPNQKDRRGDNAYASAIALLALLEMNYAGVPWDGSHEERDRLLHATAARFLHNMEYDSKLQRTGWRFAIDREQQWSEGITFLIAALLLRAEKEAGVSLPVELIESMPAWLVPCGSYDYTHPSQRAIMGFAPYWSPDNKWFTPSERSVNLMWYPWAVQAAERYLERAEGKPPPDPLNRNRVQRVLGHLILKIGPDVRANAGTSDWAYISAENLFALDSIPPPAE